MDKALKMLQQRIKCVEGKGAEFKALGKQTSEEERYLLLNLFMDLIRENGLIVVNKSIDKERDVREKLNVRGFLIFALGFEFLGWGS